MSEETIASHLKDLAFCVISVSDIEKSREFYTSILGLKETANWSDKWVEYDIGHGTLAVTEQNKEMPVGGSGVMIALETSDLDGAVETLRKMGMALPSEPWDSPACRGMQLKDPDGYSILLHEIKPRPN